MNLVALEYAKIRQELLSAQPEFHIVLKIDSYLQSLNLGLIYLAQGYRIFMDQIYFLFLVVGAQIHALVRFLILKVHQVH